MALFRILRTETARLLIMGFLIASAGIAVTHPATAQAENSAEVTAAR